MTVMGDKVKIKWSTHLQLGNHINGDGDSDGDGDDECDEQILQKLELPHHLITLQILTRLPIKSLIRFKSVSKQWYSTLSSPHFANAHLKFSPFNHHTSSPIDCVFLQSGNNYYFLVSYDNERDKSIDDYINKGLLRLDIDFDGSKDEFFLVGSCNGLVCLVSLLGYLLIWNPIIHQWARFEHPFPPLEEGYEYDSIAWGFGYVSSCDDYKVVRLVETGHPNEVLVHVFSLKSRKWKQIFDDRLGHYTLGSATRLAGVLIDETLYWIMDKRVGGSGQGIFMFDLGNEKFDKVQCLIPGNTYLGGVSFLCVIGGCLSMCRFTNRGDVSISMSKQNGQVEYIGLYRDLNLSSCSALVGFTRVGEIFILLGDRELGLIEPNSSPKKYTSIVTFEDEAKTYVTSYVPSLISPLHIANMQ